MVDTTPQRRIWEDEPQPGHKKASGWRTYNGYLNEAKQLVTCLTQNRRKRGEDYPIEVVIKFANSMTPDEHDEVWARYKRNMKLRGIVALWIREPSRKNNIHYHLIVSAPDAVDAAEDTIRSACPKGYRDRLRLHLDRIKDQYATITYITKAKASGIDPLTGQYSQDRWRGKRLWFATHIELDKYGSIGKFWHKPKAAIWKDVIEREQNISLYETDVYDDAMTLHRLVGEDVPIRKIKRSLAYFRWRESKQN